MIPVIPGAHGLDRPRTPRPRRTFRGACAAAEANAADVQPLAEGQPSQHDQLVGRVVTLDVAARIGLGVAGSLGVGENVGVVAALVGHGRQDEVRRPVDDPADGRDPVGGEVRGERPEDRDATADRGLEAERGTGPPGRASRSAP